MFYLITALLLLNGDNPTTNIPQHLQDVSVTVVAAPPSEYGEARPSSGSGVLKTRKRGEENLSFVWTAYHVIDGLRHTHEVIDPKSGTPKSIVEFYDAKIVKDLVEDGRTVGKTEMFAKVICGSKEQDLALLQVRKKNFISTSTVFYLDKDIPAIGTKLFHVGSLLGQMGSNSMTAGIISQHGRLIEETIFDQTTVTAFPGSSGGGVFLENGQYIGMLVRGAGETFNLIVPVRRMIDWTKSVNLEWAINENIPLPSDEEMAKIPVEDIGKKFAAEKTAAGAVPATPKPTPPAPAEKDSSVNIKIEKRLNN